MLKIKSNIKTFNRKFAKFTNNFNKKIEKAIEDITNQFYNQIVTNINLYLPDPKQVDDFSFMYDINITKENDMLFLIKLGENSGRVATDGTIVNPFYYFEFGFGMVGLGGFSNYDKAFDFGWDYDVNNHSYFGWYYKINGVNYWTDGFEGLGFLQKTVNWYKDNKEEIIKNALEKVGL